MPSALSLDEYGGSAWIGIVPFRMTGIQPRGLPLVPYFSETLELNVRTYATVKGVPGVYFFSLDAQSRIAVRIARRFFHLPYFDAEMSCVEKNGAFDYRSSRVGTGAACSVVYEAAGHAASAIPGTLPYFLTERYALYTADRHGRLLRGRIHHEPWQLQPARAAFGENTLAAGLGVALGSEPVLHFSRRLDVTVWSLEPC